jgi:hypothetical protein
VSRRADEVKGALRGERKGERKDQAPEPDIVDHQGFRREQHTGSFECRLDGVIGAGKM